MSYTCLSVRSGAVRTVAVVLLAFTLIAAAPMVVAHSGHTDDGGENNTTEDNVSDGEVTVTTCPDDPLTDASTSAFEQAGASPPDAATETVVACSGDYVLKVTTAETMEVGGSYVAFFTVHNLATGEAISADGMEVQLQGAATGDAGAINFVSADVDGADGLRAVTVAPNAPGKVSLTASFPTGSSAGKVTLDVISAQTSDSSGASAIPGFGFAAVLAGVVAVAVLLRRGRPPAVATLLVLSALAPMAMAGPGHGGQNSGVLTPSTTPVPGGFEVQADGLNVSLSATSEEPVQLYDLGDFSTAEGPTAEHTYATPGLYLLQMIAYDPATLEGQVYSQTATVGDDPVNDPPNALVSAEKRWVAFGDNVSLSADGTEERNGDDLTYIWSVGQADVGGSSFVYSIAAVTESPNWTWEAPAEEGDYDISVFVLDSRRGFSEVSTKVRVTESLPSTSDTFGPFEGTLTSPDQAPDAVKGVLGPSEASHAFALEFAGEVTATLNHSGIGGQDTVGPTNGIPDVDVELDKKAATGEDLPAQVTEELEAGDQMVTVTLENGVEVDYSVEVTVQYVLNPFAS